ncbi:hypothetical protein TNCV_3100831 [Trichonephila clavipes]|nr:hypothetical protein TNCV_3100831 [Trichonephila clavipes]
MYRASTSQVWGSNPGLGKINSALHPFSGLTNEYQACLCAFGQVMDAPHLDVHSVFKTRNLQCRVPDVPPHGSPPLLAAVDSVQFAGRGRHLPHLPLRGRRRAAPHLTLLLRWVPALRAPVMPAAVDQELGHSVL